jgi:hypothetical protein
MGSSQPGMFKRQLAARDVQAEVNDAPEVGGRSVAAAPTWREVAFLLRFGLLGGMAKPRAQRTFGHGLGTQESPVHTENRAPH